MRFINVRLLVSNIQASISFWRDLIKLPLKYSDESIGYAYFDTGNGGIELINRSNFAEALGITKVATHPDGYPAVLVFQVDDIDSTYAELIERGAVSVAQPQDRPAWGARSAQISDPDGYIFELYSPLKAAQE